ncbi:MAG: AAA family ATPase [Mollicutes bacterium PWAP]|nr:AAA family ATPase [Mollicutes bacterium PWAP]
MKGKIIEINTDTIKIEFKSFKNKIGHIIKTKNGSIFEIRSIKQNVINAIIIKKCDEFYIGLEVYNTNKTITGPIGDNIYGNVFDISSSSLTSPEINFEKQEQIISSKTNFFTSKTQLFTGIKIIDFMTPIFKGDKFGIFGGAGVGKTIIIKEIIFNMSNNLKKTKSIFVGIGERSREGEELFSELKESNLLKKTILFFAAMNEYAGSRFNIIKNALITAEWIRDIKKQNSIIFIDNIFRYVQAGNEISSSLGKIPSAVGYQGTLQSELSEVQERIKSNENASITSLQSVFIPADDITDPATVAIFNHIDGSIVLDRNIAAEGIFPSISINESHSSNVSIDKIGKKHYESIKKVKYIFNKAETLIDIISIMGIDELSVFDKEIVIIYRQLRNYFSQNFFVAENYTNKAGHFAILDKTINEVNIILSKEFINLDSNNFLYISDLESLNNFNEEEKIKKN